MTKVKDRPARDWREPTINQSKQLRAGFGLMARHTLGDDLSPPTRES